MQTVLSEFKRFKCVGISDSISDHLKTKYSNFPDLVFINIDCLVESFIDSLSKLNRNVGIPPNYVGITCCPTKAFEAIQNGFLDVILEPECPRKIREVLRRFQEKNFKSNILCVNYYYDFHYVNMDKLLFLKADNYTTELYLLDGSLIHSFKTLKFCHSQLPSHFQRIHNSYVINAHYVKRINYGKKKIHLHGTNLILSFSKTYIDNVEKVKRILTRPEVSYFL